MSAFPPLATLERKRRDVGSVPEADIWQASRWLMSIITRVTIVSFAAIF
jgi:hypothetical protein